MIEISFFRIVLVSIGGAIVMIAELACKPFRKKYEYKDMTQEQKTLYLANQKLYEQKEKLTK